ncbi:protein DETOXIFICATION 53 [Corylus avellana]|uniref:protein DETOXIFICATION 53 n=1 Tax=Corylus avellana TaxID=13451 RepID=UPI001E1EBCA1|nr:protein DETOXIFICATION 53 [Corylus avellana]
MCATTESRGVINDDTLISKEGGCNEDAMRERSEGRFASGFLRRQLPLCGLLRTLPLSEMGEEVQALGKIAGPIVMTTLLIYSRSIISMLFLGRLGKAELAGGSLAIGFGNITGNSILRGLSTGMDPICCQAYGAKRWSVLSQTFQKTLCLLLLVSIPISLLWLNIDPIFQWLGQDPDITKVAKVYMAFSIPELLAQAHLYPLRSFLRTQGLTTPLTMAATVAAILHLPVNYFFVTYLKLGVKGIALGFAFNTLNLNLGLIIYLALSKKPLKPWHGATIISPFQGWGPLLSLALPSAVSVCLEWWWYEIMLFLCGLFSNPQASLAAMGILIQTTGLLYIVPISLSAGLTTRVGHALGAGQPTRAQWTSIIGLTIAFAFGLAAFIFMTALRSVWGKLFTDESLILDLVSAALPVLGLCELGNSPQTAACGVLTGTARPKLGARINLCAFYIVGLPVVILTAFVFKIGFLGIWFGLLAAQFACLFMMGYTLFQTDWKHQSKRAEELTRAAELKAEKDDLESGLLTTDL